MFFGTGWKVLGSVVRNVSTTLQSVEVPVGNFSGGLIF